MLLIIPKTPFGAKELYLFSRQLVSLLKAGVPILRSLEAIAGQIRNTYFRKVVESIHLGIRGGKSFSDCLLEYPRLFPVLYVTMVRVGEEAGALPRVMSDLAALLEHEDEVRSEVGSAVAYPVFVLAFGVFTVALLLTFVLPRLFEMLQEMLQDLPLYHY